jgi:hypothetical protein
MGREVVRTQYIADDGKQFKSKARMEAYEQRAKFSPVISDVIDNAMEFTPNDGAADPERSIAMQKKVMATHVLPWLAAAYERGYVLAPLTQTEEEPKAALSAVG